MNDKSGAGLNRASPGPRGGVGDKVLANQPVSVSAGAEIAY